MCEAWGAWWEAVLQWHSVCILITSSSPSWVPQLLSGDAWRLWWQPRAMSPWEPGTEGWRESGPGRFPGGHTAQRGTHTPTMSVQACLSWSNIQPVCWHSTEQGNTRVCKSTSLGSFLETTQRLSLFAPHITKLYKPIFKASLEKITGLCV